MKRCIGLMLAPALLVGCASAPSPGPSAAPYGDQPFRPGEPPGEPQGDFRLEQILTLHIDPQAKTAEAMPPRSPLAAIEGRVSLQFDVQEVTQAGGETSLVLVARNRGSDLSDLSLRVGGERTLASPANPIVLGPLSPSAEVRQHLAFSNPQGTPFTAIINLWASLGASGSMTSGGASIASPAPSLSPSLSPAVSPSPLTSPAPSSSPAEVEAGGPRTARGRVLLNGQPGAGLTLQVIASDWSSKANVTTDAQGVFTAKALSPGDYFAYFYNDSDRSKVGYWQSRSRHVDDGSGATFPPIDLYQQGMTNQPPMDSHVSLPVTFQWKAQAQRVDFYRFRLHSQPGRSFALVYQSDKLPGDVSAFDWNGQGVTLNASNRYFWGVSWDAGPLGQGGNLYQAVYFGQPRP